ncbi:hypothetical protein HWV62_30240 [Athelia sp. TMB]|nr:hypothetical protein HWV62_30240 [Athelia sp. TMB]
MAAMYESPWADYDPSFPNQHLSHFDPSHSTPTTSFTTNSNVPVNLDKELPPMPGQRMGVTREERPDEDIEMSRETEVGQRFRGSWMDDIESGSDSEDLDLEYLRIGASTALPPSLFSRTPLATSELSTRALAISPDESLSSSISDQPLSMSTKNQYTFDSASHMHGSSPQIPQHIYNGQSTSLRSTSGEENSSVTDSPPSRSFARPPRAPPSLPDPTQYPDPYPFRAPHSHLSSTSTPPALSSAGSSSASTRSSAYTSSGSALVSGDYGHVHVASGEDEIGVAVGITSDNVVQLMASEPHASTSALGSQSRVAIDHRWSEYSASIRSRSSSAGHSNTNSMHENPTAPKLTQKPSYDMGWQPVDERDEVGLSEDDTDDDPCLTEDLDDEEDDEDKEEETTSAVKVVEEGGGLIVRGDGVPIVQLQVETGTTHMLVGSSSTPNAMPAFLANTLPMICNTLLALDISANFLVAVPPALASCYCLEELNIASNPLRVLPVFLSHLTSLRVLIADSTGISTLPETFSELDKLHTLSVRRNKMLNLPSWLCLLSSLQTLFVDGNPFQGPWKALVEPLLAKIPATPIYPLSTPALPLESALSTPGSFTDTDTDVGEDNSDPPTRDGSVAPSTEEEDTIMPQRAPFLGRATTTPNLAPNDPSAPIRQGLSRTRTTPNRSAYEKARSPAGKSMAELREPSPGASPSALEDAEYFGMAHHREMRRMKSAGDLRGGTTPEPPVPAAIPRSPPIATPQRPSLTQYSESSSASNPLGLQVETDPGLIVPKRFASLGASRSQPRTPNGSRTALTKSLWDNISEHEDEEKPVKKPSSPEINRARSTTSPSTPGRSFKRPTTAEKSPSDRHSTSHKEKTPGKWGFLKKMSMGKMRIDSPSSSGRSTPMNAYEPIHESGTHVDRTSKPAVAIRPTASSSPVRSPRIDVRLSTTGTLGAIAANPAVEISPPEGLLRVESGKSSAPSSFNNTHLAPSPSPTTRAARRRSFLPIDMPPSLSIPAPGPFLQGVIASNGDVDGMRRATPSPAHDPAEVSRREEEKQREASTRALRSVMAYLKDMNDLNQTATNPGSMYGSASDEGLPGSSRSRRPTIVDSGRGVSESIASSMTRSASSDQLRSMESRSKLRSGNTSSVATTDSGGSSEERKYKDDKAKRAMVVREIVETERTYVKGLEELVDIYIKPGAASGIMLSGSSKDSIVPAAERKIVFNGLDALFSFHKESFLPALEIAAAPVMTSAAILQEVDADGMLSLSAVNAVASMFIKHAAFMRMYSSYINNFDNALQRVKYWSSDRPATAAGGATPSSLSPSSSTVQLAGLGLTMSAVTNPNMTDVNASNANGVANLSTSQKKRIKTYLKRCRINPRHSQLNLEGYLLLPVQRIPRYRLLLEELLRSTPPTVGYGEDVLDKALAEISLLANNMNEGKRESESRRKLVQWQTRIRGRFPSPLVQPHRRLIMDGPLRLTRVVRKANVSFEAFDAQGDSSTVQVDCLAPELTPRALVGILCNDLLVLCRDPSEGKDNAGPVDLWAVLRMQTLPQPASIVHGNALRLVDNKAILYFDAPSPSDALNWFRAINLHIPASKA